MRHPVGFLAGFLVLAAKIFVRGPKTAEKIPSANCKGHAAVSSLISTCRQPCKSSSLSTTLPSTPLSLCLSKAPICPWMLREAHRRVVLGRWEQSAPGPGCPCRPAQRSSRLKTFKEAMMTTPESWSQQAY
jgi:hypothetical protein